MANYSKLSELLGNSTLDWLADDIRALLVSSAYAFDPAHVFVSDLTGELTHGSYARKVLSGKTITDVDADTIAMNAAGLTWTSLAGGVNPAKIILFKRITNDASSPLLCALDVSGIADGSQDFNVKFGTTDPGPAIELTTGAGIAGPPGASSLFGAGVPGSGLGVNGDFYVNTNNGDVYGPKASGAWGSTIGNIRGPQGTPGTNGADGTDGTDGANGADGASMRYGTGVPSSGLGINGDVYIDSASDNLYGKSAGSWSLLGNIKGSTGATGATGAQGPAASPPSVVTDSGGSRNAANGDFGKYTRLTSGSATSLTIPSGLTPTVGETAIFRQAGAGLLTFVQGSGVTLNNLTGKTLVSQGQGASFAVTCVAADVYDLAGPFA